MPMLRGKTQGKPDSDLAGGAAGANSVPSFTVRTYAQFPTPDDFSPDDADATPDDANDHAQAPSSSVTGISADHQRISWIVDDVFGKMRRYSKGVSVVSPPFFCDVGRRRGVMLGGSAGAGGAPLLGDGGTGEVASSGEERLRQLQLSASAASGFPASGVTHDVAATLRVTMELFPNGSMSLADNRKASVREGFLAEKARSREFEYSLGRAGSLLGRLRAENKRILEGMDGDAASPASTNAGAGPDRNTATLAVRISLAETHCLGLDKPETATETWGELAHLLSSLRILISLGSKKSIPFAIPQTAVGKLAKIVLAENVSASGAATGTVALPADATSLALFEWASHFAPLDDPAFLERGFLHAGVEVMQ